MRKHRGIHFNKMSEASWNVTHARTQQLSFGESCHHMPTRMRTMDEVCTRTDETVGSVTPRDPFPINVVSSRTVSIVVLFIVIVRFIIVLIVVIVIHKHIDQLLRFLAYSLQLFSGRTPRVVPPRLESFRLDEIVRS